MRSTLLLAGMAVGGGLIASGAHANSITAPFQLYIHGTPDLPVFVLTNTSSDKDITRLEISIGSADHEFDVAWKMFGSPGIIEKLIVPDSKQGDVTSDRVEYLFSGFDPGYKFSFKADISGKTPGVTDDFRHILFNNGTEQNAVVTVTFDDGTSVQQDILDAYPDGHRFLVSKGSPQVAPLPMSVWGGIAMLGALGAAHWARNRRS